MASPKPYAASIMTISLNPDSVSIEKATPEQALSERIIFCTPTESAIVSCAKPCCNRYAIARSVNNEAMQSTTRASNISCPTTCKKDSC